MKITKDISGAVKTFLVKSAPISTYIGVKAFVPKKEESRKNKQETFKKQSKAVMDAVSDPQALIDNSSKAFQSLSVHAPKIAAALSQKAVMGASFLYEKMPKNPFDGEQLFSNKNWKPSDYEISKWMKYVNTVEDPMGAFKDLKQGRLTIEQAETIKTVFPEMYQETVQNIMEELPNSKEELPYQRSFSLVFCLVFLPIRASSLSLSLKCKYLTCRPTQAEGQKQTAQNNMSPSRADKLNFSDKEMTNTQRVITRA